MKLTRRHIKILSHARNKRDWDRGVRAIKAELNQLPSDWFCRIVASGFKNRIWSRWQAPPIKTYIPESDP